jgi:hypothetical protein
MGKQKQRFRPSVTALSGTRAFACRVPSPTKAAPAPPAKAAAAARPKKWSDSKSLTGRFMRRLSGGRLATHQSELTLTHIVTAFAMQVARLAAENRQGSSATEEGDVRRALGVALPEHHVCMERVRKSQPLHQSLCE